MHDEVTKAVEEFYSIWRRELYSYALALTKNPAAAEDAVQTAVAGVLSRRRLPRDLRSYLMRSIRNAALDWVRACRKTADRPVPDVEGGSPDADHRRLLEQLLSRLPAEVREVLYLKEVVGMTFREIGAVCRSPLPTVASRYRRGLETMRKSLVEDDP